MPTPASDALLALQSAVDEVWRELYVDRWGSELHLVQLLADAGVNALSAAGRSVEVLPLSDTDTELYTLPTWKARVRHRSVREQLAALEPSARATIQDELTVSYVVVVHAKAIRVLVFSM